MIMKESIQYIRVSTEGQNTERQKESIIFGAMFRSCSSEPVVNVNVMDHKKESVHDTFYMDREVTRVIRDTVRIPVKPVATPTVKPVVKPTVLPKTDTVSK